MNIQIEEPNVLLFKTVKDSENTKTNIDDFIELFLEDGPFDYLFSNLIGCSTFNYFRQIFSVSFNNDTNPNVIEDLLEKFKNPQVITNKVGENFHVQLNRPQKQQKMVTLFPMSHNIQPHQIDLITKEWGKVSNFRFGRHKRCPLLLNNYLHIYLTDFQKEKIPDTIKINNKSITVMVQGEENILRCIYCKEKNHQIENCPYKPPQREKTTQIENVPNSYANKVKMNQSKTAIQQSPYYPPPRPSIPSTSNTTSSPTRSKAKSPQRPTLPKPTTSKSSIPRPSPLLSLFSTPSSNESFSTNESVFLTPQNETNLAQNNDDFPPLNPNKTSRASIEISSKRKHSISPSNSDKETKKLNQNTTPKSIK